MGPSRPQEDGPQRPDDEERPERDVRLPPDPARGQEHGQDDPGEEEREDRAGQRAFATGQQPHADEQLDVAQPERTTASQTSDPTSGLLPLIA